MHFFKWVPFMKEKNFKPFQNRLIIFAGSIIVCLCAGIISQQIYSIGRNGFGNNDTSAFLLWSFFYSATVSAATFIWLKVSQRTELRTRYFSGVLFGIVAGLLWSFLVWLCIGPWFLCFSFPVTYFWIAGGVVSFLYATYADAVFQENLQQYTTHSIGKNAQSQISRQN